MQNTDGTSAKVEDQNRNRKSQRWPVSLFVLPLLVLVLVIACLGIACYFDLPSDPQNKKTETQENANPSDQVPPSLDFGQTVQENQDSTEQQKQSDYCPCCYLQQAFSGEHLPDWFLVVGGLIGILIAVVTLQHLSSQTEELTAQTDEMRQANTITKGQIVAAMAPRLSIERVWTKNLVPGGAVAAFIQIRNSGPTDALAVAIDIRVHVLGNESYYNNSPHKITIPANSARVHFIKSQHILTEEIIQAMNVNGSIFRVTGYVEYGGNREDFSYKYNRNELHIPDIPELIPCDFDIRRTAEMSGSITMKFSASATLTNVPAPPDDREPDKGQQDSQP